MTVAICGVGLIGGSFALALRKAGFGGRITGISSERTIKRALELGVIDSAGSLADADVVYLAQPIAQILESIAAIDSQVRPGTLITDAGSTKAAIVDRARTHIRGARFVGGHPMAGKESRGVDAAEADLFRGRPYVLTEEEPQLLEWIAAIGARPVILEAREHDRLVAFTSHLPQLISTALASALGEVEGAPEVAGPAAADLTRLALSPYEIWRDIFATNGEPIDTALAAFIERLEELRKSLGGAGVERSFEQAAAAARSIRGT